MEQQNVRNFCIIAHIDHGKSTLADRLLEFTGTVEKRKMKEQLLDQMDLERERGITIKLQPVRMQYVLNVKNVLNVQGDKNSKNIETNGTIRTSEAVERLEHNFILNLIDTPGHVDFGYEVSRSLAAVEGAILLVDATKGVQAQTLSNLYLAIEQGLEIIPVINKIDLPNANVKKTKGEIIHILGCSDEEILLASGKTGEGVEIIVERIIEKIPPPRGEKDKPLRALIFDSKFDTYKGVLAYVRIVDGEVERDTEITMMAAKIDSKVVEVGYFKPNLVTTEKLVAGDIGYIATGLKDVSHCRVGDTITLTRKYKSEAIQSSAFPFPDKSGNSSRPQRQGVAMTGEAKPSFSQNSVDPLPGYKEVKPMVYASFYPVEGDEYNFMRDALDKLKLNDAAFTFEPESNLALGKGFRCGFLGLLHLEIIQARLQREFNLNPTITTPSVVYKIKVKSQMSKVKDDGLTIYSPSEMPDPSVIETVDEPFVKLDIVTPTEYLGSIMELANLSRGIYKNTEYLDKERIVLTFDSPLSEVIVNFHDNLKSVTSGYASMNYEFIGYRPSDLIKLDILIAEEKVEALSRIVPRERAFEEGKATAEKLKGAIPRQNFAVAIQAAIGAKIIARETVRPFRKDVTAKLYGGDVTRKRKLLEKQKKGKKKMRNIGKVSLPTEVYLAVLRK